jgi:Arc/MetJ family transcription regulator
MKRTNVILDEKLLEEATKLSGERTYSATINAALKELIRTLKVREGLKLMSGSGWWEGDLAEMRGDKPRMSDEEWWPAVEKKLSEIRDSPSAPRLKSHPRKRRRASR